MSVLVYRDTDTLYQAAATLLAGCIIEKPASVLALDCSKSLAGVYRKLAQMTADGLLDWSAVRAFNLYEHVRADVDASDDSHMRFMLYDRVNIPPESLFAPNTEGHDWSQMCNEYENALLEMGGADTALVSVSQDGSIAYNLPASELAPVTHVERTEAGRVVTVGISTLMSARRIVVVLSGAAMSKIAGLAVSGPIVPSLPASYLQLHPNAIFMLDEDAADLI